MFYSKKKNSYCITRAAALICYESLPKQDCSKLYHSIEWCLENLAFHYEKEAWDSAALIGLAVGEEKEKEYWLWYIEKVKELLEEAEEEEEEEEEIEEEEIEEKKEEEEKPLENVVLDLEDLDLPFY